MQVQMKAQGLDVTTKLLQTDLYCSSSQESLVIIACINACVTPLPKRAP